MQTAIVLMVLLLITCVLARLFSASENKTERDGGHDRRAGHRESGAFHAVSIRPSGESCASIHAMKMQRFLSEEAPTLPLESCCAAECQCKYVHHVDRRSDSRDRRFGSANSANESEFWSQRNRRISSGRRQADVLSA